MAERLVRLAERLRGAFAESRLSGRFFCGDRDADRQSPRRRERHFRIMRLQENSCIRQGTERLLSSLLSTSVGSCAAYLFAAAAVALGLYFLRGGDDMTDAAVLLPAAVLLSALPAVGDGSPLSLCLRQGRLTARFLFGFCGLAPDRLGEEREQGIRRCGAVPAGIATGVVWSLVPPAVPLLCAAGGILALLFRAVPEMSVIVLTVCFPFLPLLPHPTVLLSGGVLLSLAAFCGKWLSGRRDLRFSAPDRAALAFAAAYLFAGGIAGAASALLALGGWTVFRSLRGRWRDRAFAGLVLSGTLCACIGLWEYLSGHATLRWVDMSRFSDIGGRVCATFDNPNILAVFLLAVYPVALCGAARFRYRTGRMLSGTGALLIAGCMVVTWSRGGWLGMIAETILFLALYSSRSLAALFCLPLPVLAAVPYLPQAVVNRFASIGWRTESSVRYRTEVWQGIARMIAGNPFGIGTSEPEFRRIWQNFAISGTETVMHAHSLLPQLALEMGLAGAAIAVLFLLCLVRSFRPSGWSVAGFSALGGLLLMGLFDHLWYARGMIWLIFAVLALIPAERETHEEQMECD